MGAEEAEDDGKEFEEKMRKLTATLESQFSDGDKLERMSSDNLKRLYDAE